MSSEYCLFAEHALLLLFIPSCALYSGHRQLPFSIFPFIVLLEVRSYGPVISFAISDKVESSELRIFQCLVHFFYYYFYFYETQKPILHTTAPVPEYHVSMIRELLDIVPG